MTEIKQFEDLKCWQEARVLVKHIFLLATRGELAKEFTLTNQLKRASLSVMNNIAKGFSQGHKHDFIRFLDYSQSSAQEVKSQLYVVSDLEMLPAKQLAQMQKQCEKTRKLTLVLLNHLKESLSDRGNTLRDEEQPYEVPE